MLDYKCYARVGLGSGLVLMLGQGIRLIKSRESHPPLVFSDWDHSTVEISAGGSLIPGGTYPCDTGAYRPKGSR